MSLPSPDNPVIFDRSLVRRRRDRAAAGFAEHDFLFAEIAERLVDRLDIVRRSFTTALDLGSHQGAVRAALARRPDIRQAVACDLSWGMARRAGAPAVVADEEFLPFADGAFDLVVSSLSLHWVNDLPGALIQVRRALRPDGLFLGAMLGGDTLFELRRSLMEVEMEMTGGLSPRISPMTELRDAGGLLQRAGFALPVADADRLTVSYSSPLKLLQDLRGMGETNAVLARLRRPVRRDLILEACRRYAELFAEPDGRVPATFEVIYLAGWAPHDSQQKALRPGSAANRLADALKSCEVGTGVKPN
jgi:SAM-dependent methyltransferase